MIRLLVFAFSLMSWPAIAQNIYPALHDVIGVEADDVLNVRAEPTAGSAILGGFAPGETGIEVTGLSDDGRWGRVNTGERAGWAAMRFFQRQPGQNAADWTVTADRIAPRTLECFGTEPFWTLVLAPGGGLAFSAPDFGDGTSQQGGYDAIASSAGTGKRGFTGWLESEPLGLTGIVANQRCSDGMSDRLYGLAIDVVRSSATGQTLDVGCCRLVP